MACWERKDWFHCRLFYITVKLVEARKGSSIVHTKSKKMHYSIKRGWVESPFRFGQVNRSCTSSFLLTSVYDLPRGKLGLTQRTWVTNGCKAACHDDNFNCTGHLLMIQHLPLLRLTLCRLLPWGSEPGYGSYFSSRSKRFCAGRGSVRWFHAGTGVVGSGAARLICNKPLALRGKEFGSPDCRLQNPYLLHGLNCVTPDTTLLWDSKGARSCVFRVCSFTACGRRGCVLQSQLRSLHSALCRSRGTLTSRFFWPLPI